MIQSYPLHSLAEGRWFKLICGASYQHLPAIRNLAVAYSLAGADCIDVAADPAVITAVSSAIEAAQKIAISAFPGSARQEVFGLGERQKKTNFQSPLLMVSINDAEDPHFRKAKFDPLYCPKNCPQPCVGVCPAEAIDLKQGGVLNSLCYGCGRCLPICPQELIETHSHVSNVSEIVPWIASQSVDALEIHTQVEHYEDFKHVWRDIAPVVGNLKLLAISCTDAPNVIDYLRSLYEIIAPLSCPLIWQTDGRSMSGDIGKGTTHAAIAFARKVLQAKLPGYIQLAGGTNNYTVDKLKQEQMLKLANSTQSNFAAGVAYGSYARTILAPILAKLETTELQIQPNVIQPNLPINQPMNQLNFKLEQNQELLEEAVKIANQLVSQIKTAKS